MNQSSIHKIIESWLSQIGIDTAQYPFMSTLVYFAGVTILALIAYQIAKYILINILNRISKKTDTKWDDILVKNHVFRRLANLIPAGILLAFIPQIFAELPGWANFVSGAVHIFIIFIILATIDALLNSFAEIYQDFEVAKTKPIKGYIQIVKIILYFIGAIIVVSIILGKSAAALLTGLGAMTAVLLFVFRDPILGFVGSIQLSANDMVRPGDWIAMHKHNADGTVIDMNLTSVKVQNWDKTIASIPTYALVSDAFINWRGMEESGGRRIMRSVNIDMKSIRFSSPEMIEKFKRIRILKDYINETESRIRAFNEKNDIDTSQIVNLRRQTNVGIFRRYLLEYLKNHPDVNQDMLIQVRQLAPTETGLPMQIYCFSAKQAWVEYEMVQSDIFDHILTVIPEFGLRVFQSPTGDDFRSLSQTANQNIEDKS